MKTAKTTTAANRLAEVHAASPETRHQAIDGWLQVATAASVRKNWRKWMGQFPGWAAK